MLHLLFADLPQGLCHIGKSGRCLWLNPVPLRCRTWASLSLTEELRDVLMQGVWLASNMAVLQELCTACCFGVHSIAEHGGTMLMLRMCMCVKPFT